MRSSQPTGWPSRGARRMTIAISNQWRPRPVPSSRSGSTAPSMAWHHSSRRRGSTREGPRFRRKPRRVHRARFGAARAASALVDLAQRIALPRGGPEGAWCGLAVKWCEAAAREHHGPVRRPPAAAVDALRLIFSRADSALDGGFDRSENREYGERDRPADRCEHVLTSPGGRPERRIHPDRCGCRDPVYAAALLAHDCTRAEKAHAGDDLRCDAIGARRRERRRDHGENRASQADENVRTEPGRLAPQLAFRAEQSSDQTREQEPLDELGLRQHLGHGVASRLLISASGG